ncbi:hypothetical protein [Falsiroseomonas sp.]|uniref:hypothetical protein n=1 Tax=Falsiroseomonas sp. TaxID=2870721 RepID=UPI003566EBEA
MPERFEVYRYRIERAGEARETRYTFAPMKGVGYAGNDEPTDAHPMGNEPADVGQTVPAGHVEAPEGSRIVSMEPPILDIPGRGRLDLDAVIGSTEGEAPELGPLVRWRPRG